MVNMYRPTYIYAMTHPWLLKLVHTADTDKTRQFCLVYVGDLN